LSKEQRFYVSQVSQEELDMDLDLPDIDTLVNHISPNQTGETNCDLGTTANSNSRETRRRKRVIDDDSDDL
jgi:hypothetical protein